MGFKYNKRIREAKMLQMQYANKKFSYEITDIDGSKISGKCQIYKISYNIDLDCNLFTISDINSGIHYTINQDDIQLTEIPNDHYESKFVSCENKGLKTTFSNGYTVSVQFGPTNYCSQYYRHFKPDYDKMETMNNLLNMSNDAEIAVFDEKENYVTSTILDVIGMRESIDGNVLSNATTEEYVKILAYVASIN